jgi:uncharacterized membrane protein
MSWSALLWVVLLTLTPTLELRASIPYAIIIADWNPMQAAVVGICANIALAPFVWLFVDRLLHLFLKIEFVARIYEKIAAKNVKKLEPKIEKYGIWGLALFIGVPFPGTGVYSGCVAASLLNFKFKHYMLASALGCILAGVAVTLVSMSGDSALSFFIKGAH